MVITKFRVLLQEWSEEILCISDLSFVIIKLHESQTFPVVTS